MLIPLKHHIDAHIDVLENYCENTSTDSEIISYMFERILRKFHKKSHFKNALLLWFAKRNLNVKEDDEWPTLLQMLHHVLEFRVGADFSVKIIASLKVHYKLK